MERITRAVAKGSYVTERENVKSIENAYAGKAIDRLGCFENFYDSIVANQQEVLKKMEPLRLEGKTDTVTFKRLMAEKIMNENLLSRMNIYGIE